MVICPSCGHENANQKFCGECGAPLAETGSVSQIRKVVTVLFVDVAGSTSLGESLDPERLRRLMSQYFEAMRVVLERHGATVEKFIGDAVMAVFGIPVLHEDDALRALRAATDIGPAIEELNARQGQNLQVRVGVNTGEVVAGDAKARQNLVTGDAVNVAARLQQAAQPGEILLGGATFRLVQHSVQAEALEPLDLKGKNAAVTAYRLVSLSAVGEERRRRRSPLVGRKRQRRQLEHAFEAAVEDRDCQLFTVLGTPGVGKSRLVEEFLATIDNQAVVGSSRCLPYGEGITFWPLVETIRSLAGLSETDTSDEAIQTIAHLLEPLSDTSTTVLGSLLGMSNQAAGSDEIRIAARQLFDSIAQTRPLVLVFDDIHWAEPTFLDLIEHVCDASRSVPLLLICMARPEFLDLRPAWGGGRMNATTILLEPLDEAAAHELISHVLGGDLEEGAKQTVLMAGEGNPLFVEEMVSMLLEDGALVSRDGTWVVESPERVRIPESLQMLLAARVDGLGREERAVISRAAVVGKAFEREAVMALGPGQSDAELHGHLRTLVRRELIRPDSATDELYEFRHILIRDAAYESLPKEERGRLHERFANWLEDRVGAHESDYEEILGYHYEQAHAYASELGVQREDLAATACRYLLASGHRALTRGDEGAAVTLLTRAAALASGPERIRPLLDLADAYGHVGRFDDAERALAEVRALASVEDDRGPLAVAEVIDLSMLQDGKGTSVAYALGRARRAAAVLEEVGDLAGAGRAWQLVADENHYLGQGREAEVAIDRARRLAEAAGDRALFFNATSGWLVGMFWGDTPADEGLRVIEEVSPMSAESLRLTRSINRTRGGFLAMQGRLEEATASMERARAVDRETGSPLWIAIGAQIDGIIVRRTDPEAARRLMAEAYRILRELGESGAASTVAADLADMEFEAGDPDSAWRLCEEAVSLAEEDDFDPIGTALIVQGRVLAARGDDVAIDRAEKALALLDPTDYLNRRGRVNRYAAEIYHRCGDVGKATQLVDRAIELYEEKGDVWEADRTRAWRAAIGI